MAKTGPDESLLSRLTNWLVGTGLFEQAWAAVSFGRMNWWWSEQLCLFTVGAWTTFLATEGASESHPNPCKWDDLISRDPTGTIHGIKYVAVYMILGQLVAISVASNLFYLALSLSPTRPQDSTKHGFATPTLWLSILASLLTVALSPFTDTKTSSPTYSLCMLSSSSHCCRPNLRGSAPPGSRSASSPSTQ